MTGSGYRALLCVTTCARLERLRLYLPHYARFCSKDRRFALLVALDGCEAEYLRFANDWGVPVVYSDVREGVGLSKNRVLARYPDWDFYFFLDDDVELVDDRVFAAHVELAVASGIHHFSLFERGGLRKVIGETVVGRVRIRHGLYGGGQFNFYTGEGLRKVGGWHPRFAEYRRWGHTEHSYRFFRSGLTPAPFNVAVDLADTCVWHYPPSVARVEDVRLDEDQIAEPERELIERRLLHVPVETRAPHRWNGVKFGECGRLAATLAVRGRYPLATSDERRHCWSDFHLGRMRNRTSLASVPLLLRAVWNWPGNPGLRHAVKTLLQRARD